MPSFAADLASPDAMACYESVIGLDVRARLATAIEVFLRLPDQFLRAAEHRVCPAFQGLPGALPLRSVSPSNAGDFMPDRTEPPTR
jgi:hypothetical protein